MQIMLSYHSFNATKNSKISTPLHALDTPIIIFRDERKQGQKIKNKRFKAKKEN